VDSAPQQAVQDIGQIDSADLVVGIIADLSQEEVAEICGALRTLPGSPRIVVLQNRPASDATPTGSAVPGQDSSLSLVPWSLQNQVSPTTPLEGMLAAYQTILTIGERLGVRGCCVIASKLEHARSKWVCQLTEPLLEASCDFVAPNYARRKFEGLLNSSIISPLTRSLYGLRIQNPMGPDLGISQRLYQKLLHGEQNGKTGGSGMHLLASLVPLVLCGNLQAAQAYLGARSYPPSDWTTVSSLLSEILGPIFLAMERNAACWQRMRTSSPVRALNEPTSAPQTTGTMEIERLVHSFQLGIRDLQEIWGLILPPASLLELRKLARLPTEQFHIPDELWVRIVYDFALAHRLRTINRDHLLRSLTPLYLGWVASYAREVETAEENAIEHRLEGLSLAYEMGKPYLVSRWRWPDRFNP
jgi:glucosylglycerate synthase